MTSNPLTSQEQTVLQYWIDDGAPGYLTRQQTMAGVKQDARAAIKVMDSATLRGYLASYLPEKITKSTNKVTKKTSALAKAQSDLQSAQADHSKLASLTVGSGE